MNDLFTRVRPLVGEALERRRVAVMGSPAAAVLVEYLVACGVRRWLVMAENRWIGGLADKLHQRYGDEIEIQIEAVELCEEMGGADLALVVDDAEMARRLPVTLARLAIFLPTSSTPSRGLVAMAGESLQVAESSGARGCGGWDWLTTAPLMALAARALLLRASEQRMATWEEGWSLGMRAYDVGMDADPTRVAWQPQMQALSLESPLYRTPLRRQGTLLIAGLGSLGSVAAEQLAPWVERLVLVDPDSVEMENLVRQAYKHCQLGEPKALALATRLGAAHGGLVCEPVVAALRSEEDVAQLIRRHQVTAALVTTGTHADFAITRRLRAAGLPHVVGRCYARARYWEGIVVDAPGADGGGASYEEVRRAVAAGPLPAPTPEEVAAYGAVGELVADPATAMETGWAALWLARLMTQMMSTPALREGWLLARLAARATCFIGGVVVEEASEAAGGMGKAYGVRRPGEVHAWSAEEIG